MRGGSTSCRPGRRARGRRARVKSSPRVAGDLVGADRSTCPRSRCCLRPFPFPSAPNALAICTANVPGLPGRVVDQHLVPGLAPAFAGQRLHDVGCRHRYGRCLLERQVGWHFRHRCIFAGADVLGESPRSLRPPNTSSPGWNFVTFLPAASTDPAMSAPSVLASGLGWSGPCQQPD